MSTPPAAYKASVLLSDGTEVLRNHTFTRWMSSEWLQAATEFGGKVGLHALYAEASDDNLFRYLFWQTPKGAFVEIRSGRTQAVFEEFDRKNRERNISLLSLHISASGLYSAVWISPAHEPLAQDILAAYGITPAQRPAG